MDKIHKLGCMCDNCIKARVKQEVSMRGSKTLAEAYIKRRGGDNFPQEVPTPTPQRPVALTTGRQRSKTYKLS